MASTFNITGSGLVSGTSNSQYSSTQIPQGGLALYHKEIAVQSVSMYYSWKNITAAYQNNKFSYTWVDGTVVSLTIPDGSYSISDLNAYLESQMYNRTHYLIGSGGNSFYLELVTNSVLYAVSINSYAVPTAAQAVTLGLTLPSGATWAFPVTPATPQLTIPAVSNATTSFSVLLGIPPGTYPPAIQTTNYSASSIVAPQVSPVSSVSINCNIVNNRYTNPQTFLCQFSPNVSFGSLITVQFPWPSFQQVIEGNYQNITIFFTDQNGNALNIIDTNLVVVLVMRDRGVAS